jgi:hypothetical protein
MSQVVFRHYLLESCFYQRGNLLGCCCCFYGEFVVDSSLVALLLDVYAYFYTSYAFVVLALALAVEAACKQSGN